MLVPDTRPLLFTDLRYHRRIVLLAEQTLDLALSGGIGPEADTERIAVGGYSVGGPLAALPAPFEEFVIEGAIHHQFQQPTGADQFSNTPEISRETQQGIAITKTREWLDAQFTIIRE